MGRGKAAKPKRRVNSIAALCGALLQWAHGKKCLLVEQAAVEIEKPRMTVRRLYDILGILRGLGLVEKHSKGSFRWARGGGDAATPREEEILRSLGDASSNPRASGMVHLTRRVVSLFRTTRGTANFDPFKLVSPDAIGAYPGTDRRVYDIVNVLRLLGVVDKVGKSLLWVLPGGGPPGVAAQSRRRRDPCTWETTHRVFTFQGSSR